MDTEPSREEIIREIEARGQLLTPEEKLEPMYFVRFKDGAKEWFPESWLKEAEKV
jgi:hypothetical protein